MGGTKCGSFLAGGISQASLTAVVKFRPHIRLFFLDMFSLKPFQLPVLGAFVLFCSPSRLLAESADVVIYGGTAAAVVAAVELKHAGKSVIIVSPDQHLGGLSAGGLGFTDTGDKSVIGGLSRDFYHRVWLHYQQGQAWPWQAKESYGGKGQGTPAVDGEQRTQWIFEPSVAEAVFEAYVKENQLVVHRNEWLERKSGVRKIGTQIAEITTLSGKKFSGKVFLDATYEGDLMAAAGVSYHVGREANTEFAEQWNGNQVGTLHHAHHFGILKTKVSPYKVAADPASGLLPGVDPSPPGSYGSADTRVQAYCFRVCMTNHGPNQIPWPKPAHYDAGQYELILRAYDAGLKLNEVFGKFDPIPNLKTDTNNHGPFSFDNLGKNYDYPEANYERRKEIIQEHRNYQQGLLYFLATDPRVPQQVRERMSTWGLPKDEFKDNGNWPHQLYIREARRMRGAYTMTENELLKKRPTPDSVGMGSYTIDSHNVRRYVTPDGSVQNEGDVGVKIPGPYEIAYGALTPKKAECTNLLVPVCVSSTHIAFGSIRMEPVFMILGQSAAIAASMAIDAGSAVQDVPYPALRTKLELAKQILTSHVPQKSQ
jgi:hypothetical protein